MRDEIASLVHRVFSRGLHLKGRLQQQAQPDPGLLATEHAGLLGQLSMAHEARGFPDYQGDPRPQAFGGFPQSADLPYPPNLFLGIRYALACWVDEVVMETQPWVEEWWRDHKLETTLYFPLNDRSWKFWEQATLAEVRQDIDALEAAYLCVMLGFRGELRADPKKLRDWRGRVEPRIRAALRSGEAEEPPTRRLPLRKEALVGYRLFQRMLAAALLVAGALVLVGTFYLIHRSFSS